MSARPALFALALLAPAGVAADPPADPPAPRAAVRLAAPSSLFGHAVLPGGNHAVVYTQEQDRLVYYDLVGRKQVGGAKVPHLSWMAAAPLNKDGSLMLVGGSAARDIQVFNTARGGPAVSQLKLGHVVWTLAVSPDFKLVAVPDGKTLRLYAAAEGGRVVQEWAHPHTVNAVAFTPDSGLVVAGLENGEAYVWDVKGGGQTWALDGVKSGLVAVGVTADGGQAVGVFRNAYFGRWDLKTGKPVAGVGMFARRVELARAVMTADASRLLVGSTAGEVVLFDTREGPKQLWLEEKHPRGHMYLSISADGRRALSSDSTGTLWLYEAPKE
jgi:WD40 repeat protein